MSVIFPQQFWAGDGCASFMGARHFWGLSAGKPSMPIKFLILGGGRESDNFIFMGAGNF